MGLLDTALQFADRALGVDTAFADRTSSALGSMGRFADEVVAVIDPDLGEHRRRARERNAVRARYEGARTTKQRKPYKRDAAGDVNVRRDGAVLRSQARDLERNHDIVDGALSVMVRNIVGPNGIGIEPQPMREDGSIHAEFARELLQLHREWARTPEVTQTMDWVEAQQLACRSWLRDGEMFAQHVRGTSRRAPHGGRVPYSVELLESDHVPLHYTSDQPLIREGIERNSWGRPVRYWVHKVHPGEDQPRDLNDLKSVPAANMIHLAMRKRISGLRGVSVLASSMTRFADIKDLEESERIAGRCAARIFNWIERDPNIQGWKPPQIGDDDGEDDRDLSIYPGANLDNLLPGEKLHTESPNRPNPELVQFRIGQLRAAAAGLDISYSSLARDFDGTYSAQRQELVEQQSGYEMMTARFVAHLVDPCWREFVFAAIAAGLIEVPGDVRIETVAQADFRGPAMPWIDPYKEAQGIRLQTRVGIKSLTQVISERGRRFEDVLAEKAKENKRARDEGVVLESDAGNRALPGGAADAGAGDGQQDDTADDDPDNPDDTAARQRAPRKRAARKTAAKRSTAAKKVAA